MPSYQQEMENAHPAPLPKKRPNGIPEDILPTIRAAAMSCTDWNSIAAWIGVDEKTLRSWRKKAPEIEIIIERVRAQDRKELLAVARKHALAGSSPHWKNYVEAVHKDLANPVSQINILTEVKVLPAPDRTPITFEGEKEDA